MKQQAKKPELYPGLPITEGMLVPLDREQPPVPLKHTAIAATVIGPLYDVLVTQQFHNTADTPIEAVYVFPLPEDAAVTELTIMLGERIISGEIQERAKAQQMYQKASEAGQGAALLEQERPNIFTIAVANIQPNEQVKVQIRFHDRVPYDDHQFEFVLPTVVLPRYIPPTKPTDVAGAPVPDAERLHSPLLPDETREGHTLSIQVALDVGKLQDLASPSHPITVEQRRGTTIVNLQQEVTIPNKDFILRYSLAGSAIDTTVYTYRPDSSKPGTLLLMLMPQAEAQPDDVMPRELLFVFDRSGSMAGSSIVQAQNALQGCLRALNPGDTFNIFPFDHQVEQFAPHSLPFAQEYIDQADTYISQLYGRGGTNILEALQMAMQQPRDPERLRVVVFLTDGAVGNEDQVLQELGRGLNEARVYAFGIGSAVNRFLLDKLAEVGRGSVEYIFPGQSIEAAVERFQNRAAFPLLVDLALEWGNGLIVDTYPQPLPDLYAGQPLSVLARFHKAANTTVRLTGRTPRGPWQQQFQLSLPEATPDRSAHWTALPQVWARARLDALMTRERFDPKQKSSLRDEMLSLALDYRLLSPHTAFVAIEERRPEHADRKQADRVAVPIHLPQGTHREAFELPRHYQQRSLPSGQRAGGITFGMAPPTPIAPMAAASAALEEATVAGAPAMDAMLGGADMGVARSSAPQIEEESGSERVERALRYLARKQSVNGTWADAETTTALVLVAFVRHGHTDRAGSYRPQIRRTVRWLLAYVGQPQVAPVVAWALAELAAATRTAEHQQAAQVLLEQTQAHDNLEQGVLDYARHAGEPTAQQGVGLKEKTIESFLHDERGVLALVIRSGHLPAELSRAATTLAALQAGGSADGAISPQGHNALRPDVVVFAATAAAALIFDAA